MSRQPFDFTILVENTGGHLKVLNIAHSALVLTLISWVSPAIAGLDFLEPANIQERIRNQVAKTTIGTDIKLETPELFNGLTAAIKYRIQSEPSYTTGYFTRIDAYALEVAVKSGDLINGLSTPIGFEMDKGAQIIFARQFKSQKESLTARPYTLENLPLTAEAAKEKLQVGDFVAFQANLSFILGATYSSALANQLALTGSSHLFVSGNFWVQMFKMPDNKLRIKFVAFRNQGADAGIDLDYGKSLKVFGLKTIANKLEKIINFDPLSFKTFRDHSDLFMLDYVFNLNDPSAADLYNQMIRTKLTWKELKLANPFAKAEDLKKHLISDITEIEDLRMQDLELPPKDRRIDRVFMGSNSSSSQGSTFKIGLNILRFEHSHIYSQNKIASVDRKNNEQRYLLDSLSANYKSKIFFGLLGGVDETLSTSIMFAADEKFKPTRFVTTTMSREVKFRSVSKGDYKEVQALVRRVLPEQMYQRIQWPQWNYSGSDPVNGFFRHDIYVQPEGVFHLARLNREGLEQRLYDIVKTKPYPSSGTSNPFPDVENRGDWSSRYDYDIQLIVGSLLTVTNPDYSTEQRYQAYISLKDIPLWREIGGGFILSLLPKDRFEQLVGYQLVFLAKDQPALKFQIGDLSQDELFRSIQYIQNTLNNKSFDLRLFSNEKGEFILKAPEEKITE